MVPSERSSRRRLVLGLIVAGLFAAAACNEATLNGPPTCGPTDNCSCETDPTQAKCGGFNQTTDSGGGGGDAATTGEDAADASDGADVSPPTDSGDAGDAGD